MALARVETGPLQGCPMSDLTAMPRDPDAKALTCRAVSSGRAKARAASTPMIPHLQAFTLKRLLPAGRNFRPDSGFFPEDGDPLEIMVLHDVPPDHGVVVEVRLIGVNEAEQAEDGETKHNDGILAIAKDP
jgi:inorganic pyrophosphatase